MDTGEASGAETYTGTTFAIEEEDHTLANSLRFFLNKK
jgi:DNA-directed RNA polymerase subunit L